VKTLRQLATVGLMGFLGTLSAQWPLYPGDGKVNLTAPAPRTPDGKPDLSGVWDRGIAPPVPGVSAASQAPPAAPGFSGVAPAGPQPFTNLPSVLAGGLPLQPWAAQLRSERFASNSKEHPDAHCLPLHPVQIHSHPQPRKIVETPGLILIVYEANGGLRQIFMDGRPLPSDDAQPWWYGYSIGHWDGDTLVVETKGFRDNMWIDEQGTPITSAGRITERFRRVNYGNLEIEIRVDDPKTFTRPWSFKLNQKLMPDTDLFEFICLENEKSVRHMVGK
jgi:hypothetical protein